MKIILDIRERGLYDKMFEKQTGQQKLMSQQNKEPETKSAVFLETKVLDIGDIILQNEENQDIVLIERKTIADLFSSIKDGRYEEQSHRLIHASSIHRHNIIYLIEGSILNMKPNEKTLLYSCITSLNLLKGFSVIRTVGIQETADFIFSMADKLNRDFKKNKVLAFQNRKEEIKEGEEREESREDKQLGERQQGERQQGERQQGEQELSCKDYVSVVKKVKKDNITPENIAEIMLCQIPGISSKFAIAIMKKFGTIQNLLNEMGRKDPETDCFSDIYVESGGKQRKINKTCGESIRSFLMPKL